MNQKEVLKSKFASRISHLFMYEGMIDKQENSSKAEKKEFMSDVYKISNK